MLDLPTHRSFNLDDKVTEVRAIQLMKKCFLPALAT